MSEGITLGYLTSSRRQPNLEDLGDAIRQATGVKSVPTRKVPGLCGPNEVIQILLNTDHIAAGAVAYLVAAVSKPLRKHYLDTPLEKAGNWLLEAVQEFPDFVNGITATSRLLAAERAAGNATSIGIELPEQPRGATILITEDDPARLGLALLLLQQHGSTIRQLVADPPFRSRVGVPETATSAMFVKDEADCGISVKLDEFNRLYLPVQFYLPSDRAPTVGWAPRILRLYP